MQFLLIILRAVAIVAAILAAICFVIFPLSRYLIFRLIHYLRCLFCKAKFCGIGFMSFVFPHFFSGKPDYFLLSGKKLYAVKLKSYRKMKTKITVLSDKKWQIENIRRDNATKESLLGKITTFIHDLTVHKRLYKAPTDLALYVKNINKALADEEIDCVPLLLINPSITTLLTANNSAMVDGDTVFYGVVVSRGFFPKKPEKPAISNEEAKRVFKIAKDQLKIKIH